MGRGCEIKVFCLEAGRRRKCFLLFLAKCDEVRASLLRVRVNILRVVRMMGRQRPQVLMSLVRSGLALAYLPDFALSEPGLVRVMLSDCPCVCVETTYLTWRPSAASGWHRYVAEGLAEFVRTSTTA